MDNKILNLTHNINSLQDKSIDKDISSNKLKSTDRLKKLCEDFESILVYYLIKEAMKTIPQDQGILKKSFVEKVYEGMLHQEYAKIIAHNTRLGIAENIYNHLYKYIK